MCVGKGCGPVFYYITQEQLVGFVFTSRINVLLYRISKYSFLSYMMVVFDNHHRDAYIGGHTVDSITTSKSNRCGHLA